MPEFRLDPVTSDVVIVAANRARRPNEFSSPPPLRSAGTCDFCAESLHTPPVRTVYSDPDAPDDWLVRVVPNLYPALSPDGQAYSLTREGLHCSSPASGWHEVVIESPRHVRSLRELSDAESALVFRAYRDRMRAMAVEPSIVYGLPFKNVGPGAGASIEHIHSQIVGLPLVPARIVSELDGAARFFQKHGHCVFCQMIRDESAIKQRLLCEGEFFVAFCPYASRFAFESWVLPRNHAAHFAELPDAPLAELGRLMRSIIERLEGECGIHDYNYLVHTAPFDISHHDHYHWHIEIIPRIAKPAGFEWGTGIQVNSVAPEQAAIQLRSAIASC